MFTAFLPLKYKSERVDNKNFRIIDDKPLFFYILETISSIELIDEIVIDFDNKSVVENVEKLFKNITFVKRSKNLLDPYESVNNLIKDNLKNFKNNFIIQTHVTNPLITKNTIESALNKYLNNKNPLFSVTKYQSRFYDSNIKPINHKIDELLPTQHLPPVYEENSNFYIFSKSQFKEAYSRINNSSKIFEIPFLESIDIDNEEDLDLVKKLLSK
jgi:CMP-N-acetylneuraminic acid synthetase